MKFAAYEYVKCLKLFNSTNAFNFLEIEYSTN